MRRNDYTDIGGTGGAFLTTHWSLIKEAGSSDEQNNQALESLLLNRYWKPVYCYLRRKGHNNEQAKDLTQGFFHEVVLGQRLIEKADAAKGRFRSLLLIALNRYIGDVREKETAQKRFPKGHFVSIDGVAPPEIPQSIAGSAPERTFDYAWVSVLLEQVLEKVERECREDGKNVHWGIFCDRVLHPIMDRGNPASLKEIAAQYGIQDESKASNMIVTVKRRLQGALKQYLRESVTSDEYVKGELEHIRQFFPKIAQDSE
ncbi:MAG: sigma-70 family RNA polymerase sigma factor [Sedimentisphaerales bacterium]